jgi:Flp pilus assembly protein TadG
VLGLVGALALIIAIVFDDGSALADRQRATDIAAQAARAGADAIVPGDGATVAAHLDPSRAEAAARAYLASAGVTGTVAATLTEVTVTVTITYHTRLLSMIDITSFDLHGRATARPVPGLITPEGS